MYSAILQSAVRTGCLDQRAHRFSHSLEAFTIPHWMACKDRFLLFISGVKFERATVAFLRAF